MIKQEYIKDPTKFGGLLYESDFDTYQKPYRPLKGSYIAERIISDWNFDKLCCQNIQTRNRTYNPSIKFENGSVIETILSEDIDRSPRAKLYMR